MTTYISTPFSILPSEWDNGIVINNPCAARMNRFLAALHDKCTEDAYDIPFMDMSAKSVCGCLRKGNTVYRSMALFTYFLVH